jgi:hypothetical protein
VTALAKYQVAKGTECCYITDISYYLKPWSSMAIVGVGIDRIAMCIELYVVS